jgi:hypothetical protein
MDGFACRSAEFARASRRTRAILFSNPGTHRRRYTAAELPPGDLAAEHGLFLLADDLSRVRLRRAHSRTCSRSPTWPTA